MSRFAPTPLSLFIVGRFRSLADFLGYEIQRTAFHLGEDATDIFAQHAQRNQLHAGEKHRRDDQRGKARRFDPDQHNLQEVIDGVDEGESGDGHTDIGPNS